MKPKGRNIKAPLSLRQNISIARSLLGTRSPHLLEIPLLDVLANSYVGVSKPQSTLSSQFHHPWNAEGALCQRAWSTK